MPSQANSRFCCCFLLWEMTNAGCLLERWRTCFDYVVSTYISNQLKRISWIQKSFEKHAILQRLLFQPSLATFSQSFTVFFYLTVSCSTQTKARTRNTHPFLCTFLFQTLFNWLKLYTEMACGKCWRACSSELASELPRSQTNQCFMGCDGDMDRGKRTRPRGNTASGPSHVAQDPPNGPLPISLQWKKQTSKKTTSQC